MHLLFVCTGNICRSPMGERLTRAFAAEARLPSLTAASAGTQAVVGRSLEESAALVLGGLGGDPRGFRARQLEPHMLDEADLVLLMSSVHREPVLSLSPRVLSRMFLLHEAAELIPAAAESTGTPTELVARMHRGRGRRTATAGDDIVDPIGRPPAVHLEVGEAIADALLPGLATLAPFAQRHAAAR